MDQRVLPALGLALLAVAIALRLVAQNPPPPPPADPKAPVATTLSTQQLDDLVSPVALYPDPLLGEVLAASTYPIEIAEAEQWVRDHSKWHPSKLMDEAKKQNWDPSVQGLVAFPNVLTFLSQDMSWTTGLGNAFLAQQSDVMRAVQRLRAQAEARGTLHSTPQQAVTTDNRNGQTAIDIQPVNPEVWYVPAYNPLYVWGPPIWGYYPPLAYPAVGIGFDWGPGIDLGLCFGGWGGWGWGGWGWGPDWFGGGIILNHSFFHRFGFSHFHGEPLGSSAWAHDPVHRLGMPYGNNRVAERFAARPGATSFGRSGPARPQERFGSSGFEQRGWTGDHSAFGGYHSGGMTRAQSDHGFSSMGAGRSFGGFHGGGGGRR
jgi:hypothetical protein